MSDWGKVIRGSDNVVALTLGATTLLEAMITNIFDDPIAELIGHLEMW